MSRNVFLFLGVAVVAFCAVTYIRRPSHAYVQAKTVEPAGTPESPELRNDPSRPLQILSASCERIFEPSKPRCTAKLQFANTGGPWTGYTLVWTLRYENGIVHPNTWTAEGRQPGGIFADHQHFKNGQVVVAGSNHQFGRKKDGRQLAIIGAAVEVTAVN